MMKGVKIVFIIFFIILISVGTSEATKCSLDVVLILDSSGSISDIRGMKKAFLTLVDALLPSSHIAVIEFDSTAHSILGYTSNASAVKRAINAISIGGYTNWEDALKKAHSLFDHCEKPDLYIFASDGKPNRASTGFGEKVALSAAISEANKIKEDGIRIVTIGIGETKKENLMAISSEYYNKVTEVMNNLCGTTVVVRKNVNGIAAKGWNFTINVTGGTSYPKWGVTNDDGLVVFNIIVEKELAIVNVTEIKKDGYSLIETVAKGCTGKKKGISYSIEIPVKRNCRIYCFFNSTENNPPTQSIELGNPKEEKVFYADGTWLDCIGPKTPIWINSSDKGVGSSNLSIEVSWSERFGLWRELETFFVKDNDPLDIDNKQGMISVKLFMNKSSFYQIHSICYDFFGNENHTLIDFIVDGNPPSSSFEYIPRAYTRENVNYISNRTIKRIFAEDKGCKVRGIEWKIKDSNLLEIGKGIVYDNTNVSINEEGFRVKGDNDKRKGRVSIDLSLKRGCVHYIYYRSIDYLGNTERWVKQYVKVDTEPPKITIEPEYITKDSKIWINATEFGKCDYGGIKLSVAIGNRVINYSSNNNKTISIELKEIGFHYLRVRAEDFLGNYVIENRSVEDVISIGEPSCITEKGYCISKSTPIVINVSSPTKVRYNNGSGWVDISKFPFFHYFDKEGYHSLQVEVGNYSWKETFCVDDIKIKVGGESKIENILITKDTEINITGCCPYMYRVWYGNWTDWKVYTKNITFKEPGKHYLEVKSCHLLRNQTFIVYQPTLRSPANGSRVLGKVTLEWDGFANYTFKVEVSTNINFTDALSLNVTGTNCTLELEPNRYYWRVSLGEALSNSWWFEVGISLKEPINGSYLSSSPTLKWQEVKGAQYRIQIGKDPHFSAPLVDTYTNETEYKTSLANNKYYWRVATNVWSDTWSFIIDTEPPDDFKINKFGRVSGTIQYNVTELDAEDIEKVVFEIKPPNKKPEVFAIDYERPYNAILNTTNYEDGRYRVYVTAYDYAGNSKSSSPKYDIITIDNTPPAIEILYPENATTVSGVVTIEFKSSEEIVEPKISIDGKPYIPTTTKTTFVWNTSKEEDAQHFLIIKAKDKAGNIGYSPYWYVFTENYGIKIIEPINGTVHSSPLLVKVEVQDNEGVIVRIWIERTPDPIFYYNTTFDGRYFTAQIDISKFTSNTRMKVSALAEKDGKREYAKPVMLTVKSSVVFDKWMLLGWNTLLLPYSGTVERIFSCIEGAYDWIFYRNTTTGIWYNYEYGARGNTLKNIYEGEIYIHMLEQARFYLDDKFFNLKEDDPL
jgi:hypothetical protein